MTRDERLKQNIDKRSREADQPSNSNGKDITDRMNAVLAGAHRRMIEGEDAGAIPEAAETISLSPVEILREIKNALGIHGLGLDVLPTQLQKMQEVFETLSGLLVGEEHINLKKALALNAKQLSLIIPALDNEDFNHNKLPNFISKLTPINGIKEYHQIYWLHEMSDAATYSIEHRVKRLIDWATKSGLSEVQLEQMANKLAGSQPIDSKQEIPLFEKLCRIAAVLNLAVLAAGCLSPQSIESQQPQPTAVESQLEIEQSSFEPFIIGRHGNSWYHAFIHWGIYFSLSQPNRTVIVPENVENNRVVVVRNEEIIEDTTLAALVRKGFPEASTKFYQYMLLEPSEEEIEKYTNIGGYTEKYNETYTVEAGDNLTSIFDNYQSSLRRENLDIDHYIDRLGGRYMIRITNQNGQTTEITANNLNVLSNSETVIHPGDKIEIVVELPSMALDQFNQKE